MKETTFSIGAALQACAAHVPGRQQPVRPAPDAAVPDRPPALSARFTQRQLEVLALLCEGLPNKLICRRLNIATGTVKVHISCILRVLGVASRLEAVVMARRYGLVSEATVVTIGQTEGPLPGYRSPPMAERHAFGRWEDVVAF